jgi:hypothetical protein
MLQCRWRSQAGRGEGVQQMEMVTEQVGDGSLDIIQSIEDDPLLSAQLLSQSSLQAHFRTRLHPLPTVIIAILLLFIQIVWLFINLL